MTFLVYTVTARIFSRSMFQIGRRGYPRLAISAPDRDQSASGGPDLKQVGRRKPRPRARPGPGLVQPPSVGRGVAVSEEFRVHRPVAGRARPDAAGDGDGAANCGARRGLQRMGTRGGKLLRRLGNGRQPTKRVLPGGSPVDTGGLLADQRLSAFSAASIRLTTASGFLHSQGRPRYRAATVRGQKQARNNAAVFTVGKGRLAAVAARGESQPKGSGRDKKVDGRERQAQPSWGQCPLVAPDAGHDGSTTEAKHLTRSRRAGGSGIAPDADQGEAATARTGSGDGGRIAKAWIGPRPVPGVREEDGRDRTQERGFQSPRRLALTWCRKSCPRRRQGRAGCSRSR